jgi:hypothetical protein
MRHVCLSVFVSIGCLVASGDTNAQPSSLLENRRSITANEYIESTSPLKNGGSVTSRVQPGKNVQTVTTIANLPVLGSGQASSAARNAAPQARTAANSYPYPATSRPTAAVARAPAFNQTSARQTAFQVPTLGLTPAARTAQNCNCAPAPPQFFQPQQQGFAPAASQAPSLGTVPNINIQVPGQNGGFVQPGFQSGTQTYTPNYGLQSGIGTPQFGTNAYGGGSNWLSTFLTGTGQYPNLLNFRNLPPGTHLGQGIIGQPTAYVDGQPARNLLRWFFP